MKCLGGKADTTEQGLHTSYTYDEQYLNYGLMGNRKTQRTMTLPQNIANTQRPSKDEIVTKHTSTFPKQPLQEQTSK